MVDTESNPGIQLLGDQGRAGAPFSFRDTARRLFDRGLVTRVHGEFKQVGRAQLHRVSMNMFLNELTIYANSSLCSPPSLESAKSTSNASNRSLRDFAHDTRDAQGLTTGATPYIGGDSGCFKMASDGEGSDGSTDGLGVFPASAVQLSLCDPGSQWLAQPYSLSVDAASLNEGYQRGFAEQGQTFETRESQSTTAARGHAQERGPKIGIFLQENRDKRREGDHRKTRLRRRLTGQTLALTFFCAIASSNSRIAFIMASQTNCVKRAGVCWPVVSAPPWAKRSTWISTRIRHMQRLWHSYNKARDQTGNATPPEEPPCYDLMHCLWSKSNGIAAQELTSDEAVSQSIASLRPSENPAQGSVTTQNPPPKPKPETQRPKKKYKTQSEYVAEGMKLLSKSISEVASAISKSASETIAETTNQLVLQTLAESQQRQNQLTIQLLEHQQQQSKAMQLMLAQLTKISENLPESKWHDLIPFSNCYSSNCSSGY
ncbi:hypothetical protein ON010_g15604 [Phytophthora cinnamomi]|nr:hypothetical protein ON010_g15604 [Phytophthora cinnamomi]